MGNGWLAFAIDLTVSVLIRAVSMLVLCLVLVCLYSTLLARSGSAEIGKHGIEASLGGEGVSRQIESTPGQRYRLDIGDGEIKTPRWVERLRQSLQYSRQKQLIEECLQGIQDVLRPQDTGCGQQVRQR